MQLFISSGRNSVSRIVLNAYPPIFVSAGKMVDVFGPKRKSELLPLDVNDEHIFAIISWLYGVGNVIV